MNAEHKKRHCDGLCLLLRRIECIFENLSKLLSAARISSIRRFYFSPSCGHCSDNSSRRGDFFPVRPKNTPSGTDLVARDNWMPSSLRQSFCKWFASRTAVSREIRARSWTFMTAARSSGDARADFLKFLILFVPISSISRGCVGVQARPLRMFIQTCFKFRFKVLSVLLSQCLFLFPPRIPTQVSVCVYFPTR